MGLEGEWSVLNDPKCKPKFRQPRMSWHICERKNYEGVVMIAVAAAAATFGVIRAQPRKTPATTAKRKRETGLEPATFSLGS